jgi:hypothetical protein
VLLAPEPAREGNPCFDPTTALLDVGVQLDFVAGYSRQEPVVRIGRTWSAAPLISSFFRRPVCAVVAPSRVPVRHSIRIRDCHVLARPIRDTIDEPLTGPARAQVETIAAAHRGQGAKQLRSSGPDRVVSTSIVHAESLEVDRSVDGIKAGPLPRTRCRNLIHQSRHDRGP